MKLLVNACAGLAALMSAFPALADPLALLQLDESVSLPTEYVATAPMANGEMTVLLRERGNERQLWLTRLGAQGPVWHRGFYDTGAQALHKTGSAAFVKLDGTVLGIDAEGTLRINFQAYSASIPGSSQVPSFAAGPGGAVGFVRDLEYCEARPAEGVVCAAVPELPHPREARIQMDEHGAWLFYRTAPSYDRSVLARFDHASRSLWTRAFDESEQIGELLAGNAVAAWVHINSGSGASRRLYRLSAAGAIEERDGLADPYRTFHSILPDGRLVGARRVEGPAVVVDVHDAGHSVQSSAPIPGSGGIPVAHSDGEVAVLVWLDGEQATGGNRSRYLRMDGSLLPTTDVLLRNGSYPGVAGDSETLLLATYAGFPAGQSTTTSAWLEVLTPSTGNVSEVSLAEVPASLALGSRDALLPSDSGIALLGSTQVASGSRRTGAAWSSVLDSQGGVIREYRGEAVRIEPFEYGEWRGSGLHLVGSWIMDATFIGGTYRRPRFHAFDLAGGAQAPRVADPPMDRGLVLNIKLIPDQGRWFGMFRATSYSSAPGETDYYYVAEYSDTGERLWSRVYEGGERYLPRLERLGDTLIASHSWLQDPDNPESRWVCVIEGLSLDGAVLWSRIEQVADSNVICGAAGVDDVSALQTVLIRPPAGPSIQMLQFDEAGDLLGRGEFTPESGRSTAPSLVLGVEGGWRVVSRAINPPVDRIEIQAIGDNLDSLWSRVIDSGEPHGIPAAVEVSSGVLHIALVAGDVGESTLWRWQLDAEGGISVLNREASRMEGLRAGLLAGNSLFASLAADGAGGSILAGTLIAPSTATRILITGRESGVFADGFEASH